MTIEFMPPAWDDLFYWIQNDKKMVVKIDALIKGDYKSVGDGVFELRFSFGAGYRVYFGEVGDTLVILLCGGSKKTQPKDIAKAKEYWQAYLNEKEG
jgi:putative addiction module killer protein